MRIRSFFLSAAAVAGVTGAWAAYNQPVSLSVITGLGTGVATALGNAVNTATGIVTGGGLGTGVQTALGITANTTGGFATYPVSAGSIAITSVTGMGTGVQTALQANVGAAGAPVLYNGALGTPSSGTLTNMSGTPSSIGLANGTGLPVAGVGFASGWATALGAALGTNWATALGSALGTNWTSALGSALGTGVATALGQATNSATGIVTGAGLGTGVQTALGLTPNATGGVVTYPDPLVSNIGSYQSSDIVAGSAVAVPSANTTVDVTSVALGGVGDWDCTAVPFFTEGAGVANLTFWMSSSSGSSIPTAKETQGYAFGTIGASSTAGFATLSTWRFQSVAHVYLEVQNTTTTGSAFGYLRCRRWS